jgi:hypothetical protein
MFLIFLSGFAWFLVLLVRIPLLDTRVQKNNANTFSIFLALVLFLYFVPVLYLIVLVLPL